MAGVVVTMSGDEARLFNAMKKVVDQQDKMNNKFKDGGKASKSAGDTAAAALRGIALQYVSIQGAMQVANGLAAEFARLQEAAAQSTQKVAAAQTSAIKNLQGMTYLQKQGLLTGDVVDIQRQSGFPNREMLVEAIGAGISAGGSPEEVLSAVKAAARLNVNTPEQMQTAAAGAIDLARATGVRDAEKNLGFLLTTGAVSRVESADKLANSLARSLGSAMQTVPGQTPEDAARESAALFAMLNKAANDKQGDSTSTALITLAAHIRKIAGDRSDTLMGRIQAIQSDPALRAEFLKGMPGEAAFKLPFEMLVTEGSKAFDEFKSNAVAIDFSTQAFKENAEQLQSLTNELAFGTVAQQVAGATQAYDLTADTEARAQIQKIINDVIPRIRPGGVGGAVSYVSEGIASVLSPFLMPDAESFGRNTEANLRGYRSELEIGGIDPTEEKKVRLIDESLKAIEKILENLERSANKLSQSADVMSRNQNPARAAAAGASQ
jgi:hypothetical protein